MTVLLDANAKARFNARVTRCEGCWEWNGHRRRAGYGVFSVGGKKLAAHRASYEFHFGPIPDELVVRHKCDNPPCVNPDHLELGTIRDNARDMVERNRTHRWQGERQGNQNPRSKLTDAQVAEIKRLLKTPTFHRDIAAKFGVSRSLITMIKNGDLWKHI